MSLKNETPSQDNMDQPRENAQNEPRDIDDEFDEVDSEVQDAVTTDANEFPDMEPMDEVGDPDVNEVSASFRMTIFLKTMPSI